MNLRRDPILFATKSTIKPETEPPASLLSVLKVSRFHTESMSDVTTSIQPTFVELRHILYNRKMSQQASPPNKKLSLWGAVRYE